MMLQWWMLILLSMAKIPNNCNVWSEQFSFKLLMLTLLLFSIVMWHILKVLKWISWLAVLMLHYLCLQFEGQSCLSHKHFPSLSSGWAMKVQLISDSAVHTSRTKARLVSVERDRQQFSNRQRTEKKSPPSLKDTEADNRFTDWFTWRRIRKTYNLTHKRRCRKCLSEGSSHSCQWTLSHLL